MRDLALDRRHDTGSPTGLNTKGQRTRQPLALEGQDLAGEGRGQPDEGREGVDVVLDDLGIVYGEADQSHVDPQHRLDGGSAEARQALLRVRVEAEWNRLPDVESEQPGHRWCHHDLI